ncbi:MAG: gamma carbonic anhydrase family protein [Chthoniobacterales bacterium]
MVTPQGLPLHDKRMTYEETITANLSCKPDLHPSVYIAPMAYLSGSVRIGENSSVWPQCSLRGDIHHITIGARTNIQDGAIVHVDSDYPAILGNNVTVGHKAIIHACTIEDDVLVGMGAIILDGATIGHHSIIGAGALVTKGTKIPPGSLVLGTPGKVVKQLDEATQNSIRNWADRYVLLSREYLRRQTSA